MHNSNIEIMLKRIKETIKDFNLKDGDIVTSFDEFHNIRVSPYRVTMEIRFPDGIDKAKE